MKKKMILYELGKDAFILWILASIGAIGYGLVRTLRNLLQLGLNRIANQRPIIEVGISTILNYTKGMDPDSSMKSLVKTVAEGVCKAAEWILSLGQNVTNEEAWHGVLVFGIVTAVGVISLLVALDQLHRQERRFKRRFLPEYLPKQFTNVSYEPKKRRSLDEPLCELGLLRNYERYYTANSLQASYLGCPVSSEEIVCGGVYGNRYKSHKVRVRGQWLTVHLDKPIPSTVILLPKETKNRLITDKIAKRMVEVQFSDDAFRHAFHCFAVDTEVAAELLTREFTEKLLKMMDRYPDYALVFHGNCMYVLVHRESFDRRLEFFLPYTPQLIRYECRRLYGPLQDFTEMLMDPDLIEAGEGEPE